MKNIYYFQSRFSSKPAPKSLTNETKNPTSMKKTKVSICTMLNIFQLSSSITRKLLFCLYFLPSVMCFRWKNLSQNFQTFSYDYYAMNVRQLCKHYITFRIAKMYCRRFFLQKMIEQKTIFEILVFSSLPTCKDILFFLLFLNYLHNSLF